MTLNIILIGAVLVGLILLFRYGGQLVFSGDRELPFELRRADLIYAEHTFQTSNWPRVRARVDRAYRKANGAFILVELKTRSRKVAFPSDVIELSAQRFALMKQMNVTVEQYGYVLVQHAEGKILGVIKVALLDEHAVVSLAERRRSILMTDGNPRANGFPHLCKSCAYRTKCSASS